MGKLTKRQIICRVMDFTEDETKGLISIGIEKAMDAMEIYKNQEIDAGESNTPEYSTAIQLIAEERRRQVKGEGFTQSHDDAYEYGQLAMAAACYAETPAYREKSGGFHDGKYKRQRRIPFQWPWDYKWWKPSPKNRIRELVKAGALIVAEIERLQREEKQKEAL